MGVGAKTKGYLKVNETGVVKSFQYNPSGFNDGQLMNFNILSSPCSNYPTFHYVGTGERAISLQLFLGGTKGEPQQYLDFLESTQPKDRFDTPKILTFAFGSYVKKCIITQISREFVDFNEDLTPKYVNLGLSLLEVR